MDASISALFLSGFDFHAEKSRCPFCFLRSALYLVQNVSFFVEKKRKLRSTDFFAHLRPDKNIHLILRVESCIIINVLLHRYQPMWRNGRRKRLKIPCVISRGNFEKLRIDAGFRAFLGQRKRSIPPEHPSNLPNRLLPGVVDAFGALVENIQN